MATIEARTDDLTTIEVDAVVNAANEQLHHGGGVAAALAEAGGPSVQAESDDWVDEHGEVEIGSAAVTTAGDLPAGCIVHVVGPRYAGDGEDAARLASSVTAALDTAVERDATSIALPAISAGIFGYPMADATRVIVRACRSWVTANPDTDLDIVLVGVNDNVTGAFQTALDDDLPA